jgi:hypothetical protein
VCSGYSATTRCQRVQTASSTPPNASTIKGRTDDRRRKTLLFGSLPVLTLALVCRSHSRLLVAALQARIRTLEELCQQVPANAKSSQQRPAPGKSSRRLLDNFLTIDIIVAETGTNMDIFVDIDTFSESSDSSDPGSAGGLNACDNHSVTENDASSSDDSVNKRLLQKISTKQGAITVAEDGKLRYYGPSSNRHLLYEDYGKTSPGREERLKASADVLRAHGLSPSVDRALRDHLINIYFTWNDPFFHLIDRDIFLKHMELAETDPQKCYFYSPALLFAIMAVSAPNTDSPLLGSDVDGNGFMSRARILIEHELDSAEVTTAQALVLMGVREASIGRDSRGWIYNGMSLRIVIDLGLHCDDTSRFKAGEFSDDELKVRNTTFWGCYIYDKYVFLRRNRELYKRLIMLNFPF